MKKYVGFGFTLIELLVVISIISLLSTIALASLSAARNKAGQVATLDNTLEVEKGLEFYYTNTGHYPLTPISNTYGLSCWECNTSVFYDPLRLNTLTPYLSKRPCDRFAITNPDGSCSTPASADCLGGYYYKVDPTGKDYKLSISYYAFSASCFGNPPEKFIDNYFTGFNNTISLYSSERAKRWPILCTFGVGGTCL